jgi:hypothetical protein
MTTSAICSLLHGAESSIAEYLIEELLHTSHVPPHAIEPIMDTVRGMAHRIKHLEEKIASLSEIPDLDDVLGALTCMDPLESRDVSEALVKQLKEYQAAQSEAATGDTAV